MKKRKNPCSKKDVRPKIQKKKELPRASRQGNCDRKNRQNPQWKKTRQIKAGISENVQEKEKPSPSLKRKEPRKANRTQASMKNSKRCALGKGRFVNEENPVKKVRKKRNCSSETQEKGGGKTPQESHVS